MTSQSVKNRHRLWGILVLLAIPLALWWTVAERPLSRAKAAATESAEAPAPRTRPSREPASEHAETEDPMTPTMQLAERLQEATDEELPALEEEFWNFLLAHCSEKEPRELAIHWIVTAKRVNRHTQRWAELLEKARQSPEDQNLQWLLAEAAREAGDEGTELESLKRIVSTDADHLKRLARLVSKSGDYEAAASYLAQATATGTAEGLQLIIPETKLMQAAGQREVALGKLDALMVRIKGGTALDEERESVSAVAAGYRALGENRKAGDAYLFASEISQLDFRKERLLLESLKCREAAGPLSVAEKESLTRLSHTASVEAVRAEAVQLLKQKTE